jgi:NTP pyrophosphatase (non-canonical NTP hydrolase)
METEEVEGTMTLEIAQKEVVEWALRNFGEQGSYRPLMGMLEELGEFCEARDRFDVKNMRDAIGDIGIYMLHYCAIRGWSMSELWDDRVGPTGPTMSTVKALCHSQLKGEQNIRGGAARHDFLLKKELSNLLWRMDQAAIDVGTDCLVLIYNIWEKVKQRDWQKNPNNADKVAAGASPEGAGGDSPVVLEILAEEDAKFIADIDAAVEASRCEDTLRPDETPALAETAEAFHAMLESKNPSRSMFSMELIEDTPEVPGPEAHRNTVSNG